MSRLPSIRLRLTRLLVAVALGWGLLVSVVVWLAVRHEVDELLDETLQASAEVLGRLLSVDRLNPKDPAPEVSDPVAGRHEHYAWQLIGPGGQVLLRSARAPQQAWLSLPLPGFSDAADGWRLYGLPLDGGEHVLYVAQARDERLEAQAEVAWSSIVAALAIGAAGAWWLRRRVLRELQPLAELPQVLDRYEPLPPAVPLPPASHRELAPVHEAIEALGQRLARRVANEQAFSAHVAHALRTPLAGIDTQLAVAQREAGPELQPRLARAREAAGRLARVVSALLALFRSGTELHWQLIDLPSLVERLPHDALALQLPPGAAVRADADLLTAALINLIDNAVRHGARSLQLQMLGGPDGQRLRLLDDGRGVDAERRADLDQALRSQAYEGRMGLGLMLADLVARAHGGALSLPAVAAGFAVELRLGLPPASAIVTPMQDTTRSR